MVDLIRRKRLTSHIRIKLLNYLENLPDMNKILKRNPIVYRIPFDSLYWMD